MTTSSVNEKEEWRPEALNERSTEIHLMWIEGQVNEGTYLRTKIPRRVSEDVTTA
jgi:hypothetical protein